MVYSRVSIYYYAKINPRIIIKTLLMIQYTFDGNEDCKSFILNGLPKECK